MIKRALCVIPLVDVVVDIVGYIWRCNLEHNVILDVKALKNFNKEKSLSIGDICCIFNQSSPYIGFLNTLSLHPSTPNAHAAS